MVIVRRLTVVPVGGEGVLLPDRYIKFLTGGGRSISILLIKRLDILKIIQKVKNQLIKKL